MITDKSFDFGFSLVSENELREHENILRETIANETEKAKEFEQQAQESETELNERMNGLVGMIMPLLNNLSKDPSKEYIFWPDRVERIQEFITVINEYVSEE